MNDMTGLIVIVWQRGWALVNKRGFWLETTCDEEIVKAWVAHGAEPEWKDSETGEW